MAGLLPRSLRALKQKFHGEGVRVIVVVRRQINGWDLIPIGMLCGPYD